MKEFEFIEFIRASSGLNHKNTLKSIGDDCAILSIPGKKELLFTVDALCEGTHFSRKYFRPFEIGFRAAAANISDICAMGGVPLYALVSIGFPKKEKAAFKKDVFLALMRYMENYGAQVIGGDTVSCDRFFISVTLVGEVENGRAMKRSGAGPGDLIFVTGLLGGSRAGLDALRSKPRSKMDGFELMCAKKHLTPEPRYAQGRMLSSSGLATSCIDLSDGVASDITRVCEQSECGAVINVEMLPASLSVKIAAKKAGKKAADYALYGGEDFELMFTVKPGNREKLLRLFASCGMPLFEIGRMTKKKSILLYEGGRVKKMENKKIWAHFR